MEADELDELTEAPPPAPPTPWWGWGMIAAWIGLVVAANVGTRNRNIRFTRRS